jgi:hypothetical protein
MIEMVTTILIALLFQIERVLGLTEKSQENLLLKGKIALVLVAYLLGH